MEITTTRLRWVSSKDPDMIAKYTSKLISYKVEIKSIYALKGKHFLWFVLPESDLIKESNFGSLD